MAKYTTLINKLCKGLLKVHNKVYYVDTQQFFSTEQQRVITMFVLSERVWSEERGRYVKQQVMKTASQIDLVRFLGDTMKQLNAEAEEDDSQDDAEEESEIDT